jgi:tetratricopeptide (TPR) repeat protein
MVQFIRKYQIFITKVRLWIILQSFLVFLFYVCCLTNIAAQSYSQNYDPNTRTAKAIGTIEVIYSSKNSNYTKISYYVDNAYRMIKLYYCISKLVYKVGDKLIIKYDPNNRFNEDVMLEQPYFEKGELPDTTEGVLHSISPNYCTISYKTFDSSDSLDVRMKSRDRYLSLEMFDTLSIRYNTVYKIIYNKHNEYDDKVEVLFNEIIDSTHQKLNKHLYSALERISNGNPIDALGDLNDCIAIDLHNAYYYFQKAKVQENIREYINAEEDFSKYIQMKPSDKRGYVRRATLYIQTGNFEAAQKDVTTLFSMNNQDDEAYYLQGVIYYHKRDYRRAIDSYTSAINYSKRINNEVYYYDRAEAREKLYGNKNRESKNDFKMAKEEAQKNHYKMLHGHKAHPKELHYNEHSLYFTATSDNSYATTTALHSNMGGELIFPYTINTNNAIFDKTFSLNTLNHSHSFSLGIVSLEVGGFKRFYGRLETSVVINDGKGTPGNIRSVLGYNIKFTKNDFAILRPEVGFSYLNRINTIGTIDFNGATQINIMGQDFPYYTTKNSTTDRVNVSFRENVFCFSPAIGIWLLPYSSKFVMRFSAGYNWTLSQNYSIYFKSNKEQLREQLDLLNLKFSNTGGNNSNFFNYQGPFVNVGLGVRF